MTSNVSLAGLRTIVEARASFDNIASAIVNFCSSVMGESVTLTQVLAVVSVIAGLCMMPFVFGGDYAVGGLGFLLSIVGSNKLAQ